MRHWIVAAVIGMVSVAVHAEVVAPGPIKLSAGVEAACEAIAAASPGVAQVMLIDVPAIDATRTRTLLDAINDRRELKGSVMAVCTSKTAPTRDGAAIVALACDAMVLVEGASLVGAETTWCKSASSRERIGSDLARLGRIDPKLAARFCESTTELTWTEGVGFNSPGERAKQIAAPGKPLSCTAPSLRELGIEAHEADSPELAIALISEGRVAARKPKTSAKLPGSPAPAKSLPTGADAKVAEQVAEYATALAELKSLLREFDDFFEGRKGRWKWKNPGLRWVWSDQAENTDHADTRMACQRLQRDMKTKMSNLDSCLKSVERILKDKGHPEVVRMTANKAALDGLRAAFERNKISNYETFFRQVMALK